MSPGAQVVQAVVRRARSAGVRGRARARAGRRALATSSCACAHSGQATWVSGGAARVAQREVEALLRQSPRGGRTAPAPRAPRGYARRKPASRGTICWRPSATGARHAQHAVRLRRRGPARRRSSARSARTRRAWPRPAARRPRVSRTLRVVRRTSGTPAARSSSAMRWLIAALLRPRRCAAAVKLPALCEHASGRAGATRAIRSCGRPSLFRFRWPLFINTNSESSAGGLGSARRRMPRLRVAPIDSPGDLRHDHARLHRRHRPSATSSAASTSSPAERAARSRRLQPGHRRRRAPACTWATRPTSTPPSPPPQGRLPGLGRHAADPPRARDVQVPGAAEPAPRRAGRA